MNSFLLEEYVSHEGMQGYLSALTPAQRLCAKKSGYTWQSNKCTRISLQRDPPKRRLDMNSGTPIKTDGIEGKIWAKLSSKPISSLYHMEGFHLWLNAMNAIADRLGASPGDRLNVAVVGLKTFLKNILLDEWGSAVDFPEGMQLSLNLGVPQILPLINEAKKMSEIKSSGEAWNILKPYIEKLPYSFSTVNNKENYRQDLTQQLIMLLVIYDTKKTQNVKLSKNELALLPIVPQESRPLNVLGDAVYQNMAHFKSPLDEYREQTNASESLLPLLRIGISKLLKKAVELKVQKDYLSPLQKQYPVNWTKFYDVAIKQQLDQAAAIKKADIQTINFIQRWNKEHSASQQKSIDLTVLSNQPSLYDQITNQIKNLTPPVVATLPYNTFAILQKQYDEYVKSTIPYINTGGTVITPTIITPPDSQGEPVKQTEPLGPAPLPQNLTGLSEVSISNLVLLGLIGFVIYYKLAKSR
jgi:hypothetical protein